MADVTVTTLCETVGPEKGGLAHRYTKLLVELEGVPLTPGASPTTCVKITVKGARPAATGDSGATLVDQGIGLVMDETTGAALISALTTVLGL
jgi:hypothetical protein